MPQTMDERLAYVEGTLNEQSRASAAVRDSLGRLEQRIDARFSSIDARFSSIDARFSSIDARFNSIDARFNALDDKISRQFLWLVGIQITILVAVLAAALSRG